MSQGHDCTLEDTIYISFTSRAFATGIPTVLAGTPVVSAYEDAGLTQITAGITLGVDHDSVVGLNMLTIAATAANGYESGKDYNLVITTGTVGGVSAVGETVGRFTIGRSAAAVDLANGTDGLGAIKTDTAAIKTKTDFLPSATAGASGGVFIAGTNAATTITTSLTTTFTGNLTGSVGSVTGAVGSVTAGVTLADGAHGGGASSITLSDYTNFQGAAGSDRLLMVDTTIATLASQTSFTLTAGSTDNDAYNGCTIIIEDVSTATQKAIGIVDDYTGSTKTVTLLEDPGVFTMATTDKVYILAEKGIKATTAANYHLTIDANGRTDVGAWLGEPVTTSSTSAKPEVDVCSVSDDVGAANNLELDYDGTGYAKANSTIGTTTTNTDMRGTDSASTHAALDVWHVAASSVVTASTIGLQIKTNVDAVMSAIETDTQDLQAQIGTAGAGLTDLGGMSTAMKAEIESEVNDALDTAISELGVGAPTATPTIRTGLMLLYMSLRNKTVVQTSGVDALELYNAAGTLIAKKVLTDDGSDLTEAAMTSG